jgi:membrane protein YqaA with SNARE-associated domain
MLLLLSTFCVALLSALFPLVNAEAYLAALAALGEHPGTWPVAAVAATGQTCGKVLFFQLGRSSLDWQWVRRRTDTPKWQAHLARWQRRSQGNPWASTGLVGASALLGLPPLAVISVLAGQLRVSLALFTVSVFVGRTLRFAAVLGGVALLS